MNKWLIIVGREFRTRVRRKAFIISTLLGPFLFVGFIALIVYFTQSSETNAKVLVVDSTEILTYEVESGDLVPDCIECFPEREFLEYRFSKETMSTEEFLASDFTAMVEYDDGILQNAKALLQYETAAPMRVKSAIKRDLSEAVERIRVKQEANLDYET